MQSTILASYAHTWARCDSRSRRTEAAGSRLRKHRREGKRLKVRPNLPPLYQGFAPIILRGISINIIAVFSSPPQTGT